MSIPTIVLTGTRETRNQFEEFNKHFRIRTNFGANRSELDFLHLQTFTELQVSFQALCGPSFRVSVTIRWYKSMI